MSDPALIEFMKQDRYKKIEKNTFDELDKALKDLNSEDIAIRKFATQILSTNARKDPEWGCYPIRLWFLNKENRALLFENIKLETDETLQADLLRTLMFFHERYILHYMWQDENKEENVDFAENLKSFLDFITDDYSADAIGEKAYILAMLGDSRSWDLYNSVLPVRTRIFSWFEFAYFKYGKFSMTPEQASTLITTLNNVLLKIKNRAIEKRIKEALRYCKTVVDNSKQE